MDTEDLVLAVLNSTPTVDGARQDLLHGRAGDELARRWGGAGGAAERRALVDARRVVQGAIENGSTDLDLDDLLGATVQRPRLTPQGIEWTVETPARTRLAVTFLQAWTDLVARHPGRLRVCANDECTLFFVDHSRASSGKWCSMAGCGNRMKARRHHQRTRSAQD